jgi:hypothetical protein
MKRLCSVALLIAILVSPAYSEEVKGQYLEARTCDIYTGACFANADTNLIGRNGVMAWRIDRGSFDQVKLDGLTIVAVVASKETLGLKQNQTPKSVIFVDSKATPTQRDALIQMAKTQAGDLLGNVIATRSTKIDFEMCECQGNVCAKLTAGDVRIETKCMDTLLHKSCGNDCEYYPPLAKGVVAKPALTVDHTFSGKDFNETWSDSERRGAYVGTFAIR